MKCKDCGRVLYDGAGPFPASLSGEHGTPRTECPNCGSTIRSYELTASVTVQAVASISAKVQRAWNNDRLAVLLFLLTLGAGTGVAFGLTIDWLVGLVAGFASLLVGAVVLWALLHGPLARVAANAMHRISGR